LDCHWHGRFRDRRFLFFLTSISADRRFASPSPLSPLHSRPLSRTDNDVHYFLLLQRAQGNGRSRDGYRGGVFVSAPENHTMSLCDYDVRIYGVEALPVLRARTRRSMTPFFCANNRVRGHGWTRGAAWTKKKVRDKLFNWRQIIRARSAIILVLSSQRAMERQREVELRR